MHQADKLYGAQHYDHYDFLLALTDRMGGIGLEHHRSSENGADPDYFTDWDNDAPRRATCCRTNTPTRWNGKFRRPADLWTPNYNTPMRDSLLWVYEGQTQYWGYVLAARSGLVTKQQALDALAITAATYDTPASGASGARVEDTTNDPIVAARRPVPWTSWQRSEDYYSEGQLVWLDADTLIRERTGGKKSLDDFARAFFGVEDGSWVPVTYTFDDVVAALNEVQPYDWADVPAQSASRAVAAGRRSTASRAAAGSWSTPTSPTRLLEGRRDAAARRRLHLFVGLTLNARRDHRRAMGRPGLQGWPDVGASFLAVNGIAYDADRLKEAITAAKGAKKPIS